MSHLMLNDLPPELIDELRRRAQRHGRPISEEAKALLEGSLGLSKARALGAARRLRVHLTGAESSPALLRQLRER
jgi:plasmid stability protein